MLKFPHLLAEINTKVLETTENVRMWNLGNPSLGAEVHSTRRLDELTCSGYFVLPEMEAQAGPVSLLTIARGRPAYTSHMPSFWDPVELRDELGGVYSHVTYDPSRCLFKVGMNVGGETPELLGVTLEGAPPELVCGRVLALYFEISEERLYVSIHNRFATGDVSLDGTAPSTGGHERPWSKPCSGHWWLMCGMEGADERSSTLPPGFGISNLRVTLGADNDEAVGSLGYNGALDHLVAQPPTNLSTADLKRLAGHVKTLQGIAKDIERIRLQLPLSLEL